MTDRTVPWCTVAPINPRYDDEPARFTDPVDLGNRVSLAPCPEWVRQADIGDCFDYWQRKWLKDSALALLVDYQADSYGNPDPAPDLRWLGDKPRGNEDRNKERIEFASIALWIAQPSQAFCEPIIHAECLDDGWLRRGWGEVLRLVPHQNTSSDPLTNDALASARQLNETTADLQRDTPIWFALRTAYKALSERNEWEVRYLLFWVAMEALFGAEDAREVTFRLSQRAALFMGADASESRTIFRELKEGYGWRCKVVHGMRLSKLRKAANREERSSKLMATLEEHVRLALTKILNDPESIALFAGKSREQFLDELAF